MSIAMRAPLCASPSLYLSQANSLRGVRKAFHRSTMCAATRFMFTVHARILHGSSEQPSSAPDRGVAVRRLCADPLTNTTMVSLECAKNNESYMVVKHEGEVVEDFEGLDRPLWKCTEKCCPFPGCSDNAWHRLKTDLWSLESQDAVKSYLKQHGMNSDLHGKHKSDPLPEDKIDDILRSVDIEQTVDTFADRQSYRQHLDMQRSKQEKRKWEQDDGSSWRTSASSWREAADHNVQALHESVANLASTVATMAASSAAPPRMPLTQALTQGPSPAEVSHVPAFINAAITNAEQLDNGATLSCNEKMVTVPFSKLLLARDTMTRGKEACKQALASLLTPMNQLRTELGVLANAEAVMDELIKTTQSSSSS